MIIKKALLWILASLSTGIISVRGPSYEQRSLNPGRRAGRGSVNRPEWGVGNRVSRYKNYTSLLKKGKMEALIGTFIRNTVTTYFRVHGESITYTNGSNLTFTQELNNTGKILYSEFADKNVFFLITHEIPGGNITIHSYSFSKYSKKIVSRGSCPIVGLKGASLEIYSVKRFGDTKIFYIFAKETGLGTKNWLHTEYHGFSNKILHTYRVAITENDQNYNIAEAMPSNNFDDYNYTYIVQGVQDPLLEKNIDKIYLRVTIIKKSSPEKYSKSEVFELNFQEQINQKSYQVVGLGYFYPSINTPTGTDYKKQYATILVKKDKTKITDFSLKILQVKVSFSYEIQRIQVAFINEPTSTPFNITSCHHRFISQANRGEIILLCRDPASSEVQILSMGFQQCMRKCYPQAYSPYPKLKMSEDEAVSKIRFINVAPDNVYETATPISPMMMVKVSSPSGPTRVLTAPYKGGMQQPKKNTLWQFEGFSDFVVSQNHYHYFLFEEEGDKRVAAAGNLGLMSVTIDLESYKETVHIEALGLNSDGHFTSLNTTFKLTLLNDTESFWNVGVDNGGPPINQLYKFEDRLFNIDNENGNSDRYFVITGNLKGPQRVLPSNNPNRLNIQFYTESKVRNITIGFELDVFKLNNTITSLAKTFLRPRKASIQPSRRKTLEVFTNCSLTMESNFETMWCYNHFFQGYPKTKDPKDAYLGAVGFSRSLLGGRAGEILELIGDTVVNIVFLSAFNSQRSRKIYGIQVPEWDKRYPNSSFISDYAPARVGSITPFYLTCNLTHPTTSRPCTYYETRMRTFFNTRTTREETTYFLALIEKFDLNQVPEFEGQHVLKIGAAGYYSFIFYVTRKVEGQRSDIKIISRSNYTLKINSFSQQLVRYYLKIDHFELPFELGNDDNFDICFDSPQLITFVSPSEASESWFPPKIYIYWYLRGRLDESFISSVYQQNYWKEISMDDFGFLTITRLQCFKNYFVVIGDDLKIPGKTRLAFFGFNDIGDRFSDTQLFKEGFPVFFSKIDRLNLRRYDEVLDKAPPGLEYQIKFIRLTQRNQIVFDKSTFLVFLSAYNPWYRNDDLLKGTPPNTMAESSLSKNYTDEINFEAKALFHESIYYLKGFLFEDEPVDINQKVVSSFGPPELNLTNSASFSYVTLIDKTQLFESRVSDPDDKIQIRSNTEYNVSDLVEVKGTIISLEVYYSGGQVYNLTRNVNWPILTDKLYLMKEHLPNRNKIMRRFSTIIDFSAVYPNRTKDINQSKKDKKSSSEKDSSETSPVYKQFISKIYLDHNTNPVDVITTQEQWEHVDIFSGSFNSQKVKIAVFQSQYYNSTYSRYQTKVLAKIYTKTKRKTYFSMDAFESTFFLNTFRSLYMRQEDNTLVPYIFISGEDEVGALGQFFHTFKGEEDFTGFKLETPGYETNYNFIGIPRIYPIKAPNRFYYLGRAGDYRFLSMIMKAEYDFESKKWLIAKNPPNTPLTIDQIDKEIKFMKCTQASEFGDQGICLLYSGDGTSYVILYDPGDSSTPQGVIKSLKQIYIPPSNEGEVEDTFSTFELTSSLVIKSIRNRSREFQVKYSDHGVLIEHPDEYLYSGFMVWDLSRESQLPVRAKYFTTHFTDFTLAGNSIWTCSPRDGESAVFNLTLSADLDNLRLSIPDVTYLRTHFSNIYLRAKFVNGTVLKVPFNLIFSLPPDFTYDYAYFGLGLVIVLLTLVYVIFRAKEERVDYDSNIRLLERRRTESLAHLRNLLPEEERGALEGWETEESVSKTLEEVKETTTNEMESSSQDVML